MDFQELLSRADSNKAKAAYEASVSRYNSDLPPPKKLPKSSVKSDGIRRFLEKKKAEEDARVAEAKKKREQLLALRSQSTKNNKKAKIMASRTKDNDFSRIRLTGDEIEAKKKREAELIRQNLAGKVERMKARIEMEEKEKLLPRKRKRKSKNGEHVESHDDNIPQEESSSRIDNSSDFKKDHDKAFPVKSNGIRKAPKPLPPSLSFSELLKIAEKKQHEPLEIVPKKKEEGKPMTKKERRLKEEELERIKRKQERLLLPPNAKSNSTSQITNVNKKILDKKTEKSKNPVVIHVAKNQSEPIQESSKFKIHKGSTNTPISKNGPIKTHARSVSAFKSSAGKPSSTLKEKSMKSSCTVEQKKPSKPKGESGSSQKDTKQINRSVVSNKGKNNPSLKSLPKKAEPVQQFDEDAIEKRIREKIEKEMEEKLLAKFGALLQGRNSSEPVKAPEAPKPKISEAPKPTVVKKEPTVIKLEPKPKKVIDKPKMSPKELEKFIAMKKQIMERKRAMEKSKIPQKKPFHMNPYLDPPRRLLEPQRPPKISSRRIESDDEDDEDDDMSDFIDNAPNQNDDDYSKYIQEIFNYDRSRYLDDDDDDIEETSFAEQMKEEIRSARVGYLEDLEEERKENARKKKKKQKG